MKKAILTVMALSLATTALAQGQNLLVNPGFEEWVDDVPVGWASNGNPLTRSDDAHSGQAALRIVAEGEHNRADVFQAEKTDLQPDTQYLASVWAKGKGRLRIQLSQYDPAWVGGCSMLHADLTEEWTEYRFFYGAVGDEIKSIRFDLYLGDVGAWAVIDDVSFTAIRPVQPPGENLVPNGEMKVVGDDGAPERWTVGRQWTERDRELAVGPDGSRALTVACTPTEDTAPDMSTWWDWSAQPPPSVGWINAAASETFEVEPGRTLEIAFKLAGRGVRTYHTKLFWLDENRSLVKWFTVGPRHDGDWDWERVHESLTVPSAGVHYARIEFWARAAGGRLWIDDVEVRPSRGRATGWVEARYDVEPIPDAAELPEASVGTQGLRQAAVTGAITAPRIAHSQVKRTEEGLDIHLAGATRLLMPLDGDAIVGITQVRWGATPLRNPDAPPIAPLIETHSGGHYSACRYLDHEVRGDEVIVRTALVREGVEDTLEWHFRPEEREIAGERCAGYAYRYRFVSDTERVLQIADRATWELDGDPVGVTVVTQNAYAVQNQFTITPESTYAGDPGTRFAGGDGLDYQCAGDSAILSFYDERIPYVDTLRAGGTKYIAYRDTAPFAGDTEATTAWKCVLLSGTGSHDAWSQARDYVYNLHAGFWGIEQHTPMPVMNVWGHWQDNAKHDDLLGYFAREVVPQVGALGFKVFAVHSIWGKGGCSLDYIVPGEEWGGTQGVKALCDAAAAQGMIVQAWAPTAHLWQHSPLFEQNPQWHLEGANGKPPTTYCWPDILGTRFATGYADYAVEAWRKIREETGLGALWLDSYKNFTHGINLADRAVKLEQATNLFRFHARLSELGYVLYTESTGSFGIPAAGFPAANIDTASPHGPDPMTRYGTSSYLGHRGNEAQDRAVNDLLTEGDYYYRCLANKAPAWLSWPVFSQTPERHAKIAQNNRDYVVVVEHMKQRTTLPDGAGVMWYDPEAGVTVLFAFADGTHEVDHSVTDVTTGEAVQLQDGQFTAEAMHTYLMRPR